MRPPPRLPDVARCLLNPQTGVEIRIKEVAMDGQTDVYITMSDLRVFPDSS